MGIGLWLGYLLNAFLRKPLYRHVTKMLNGEYHVIGYNRVFRTLLLIVIINFVLFSSVFALVEHTERRDWDDSAWFKQL